MWQTFLGLIVTPRRALTRLERRPRAALDGISALLIVSLVYTLILFIFVRQGYPAAAPSVLMVPTARQYQYQIWYQVPLFFATTALTALALGQVTRMAHHPIGYGLAFARIALATAIPFALTTMLVELTAALLMAAGAIEPLAVLQWLTGSGAWFATLYQSIGLLWLLGLMIIVVKVSSDQSWLLCGLIGLALVIVYGLPVALLIR